MAYARGTEVSVDRSMAQVRQVLFKNGAQGVAMAESREACSVRFIYDDIPYKFSIQFPSASEPRVVFDKAKRKRTLKQIESFIEKEKMRLWRAMLLYITAAIEAHNNGLVDLKKSFMANMITSDGKTIYEKVGNDLNRLADNPKFLLE